MLFLLNVFFKFSDASLSITYTCGYIPGIDNLLLIFSHTGIIDYAYLFFKVCANIVLAS